jgi:hypothetical protein
LCFGKGKIHGIFFFESMNLGMFDRFCSNLNVRAHIEERVALNKFDRNREKYVILCIERIFGLISGCRNLERIFADCRYNNVIPVRSTGKIGDCLKEREDLHCVIIVEDRDILLRNALV